MGGRQNDGGYRNDVFSRVFRQRDVRKLDLRFWRFVYNIKGGGARQNDGGYRNDVFPRVFRQRDVRKFDGLFFAELYVIGNGCMYLPRQSNSAGSLTSGLVVEWGSRGAMLPRGRKLVGV